MELFFWLRTYIKTGTEQDDHSLTKNRTGRNKKKGTIVKKEKRIEQSSWRPSFLNILNDFKKVWTCPALANPCLEHVILSANNSTNGTSTNGTLTNNTTAVPPPPAPTVDLASLISSIPGLESLSIVGKVKDQCNSFI